MRLRALALAGLSTVLLTACSSTADGSASPSSSASSGGVEESDRTGPELEEAAISALEEVDSVHIVGTMTMDGEQGDLDLRISGDDVAGSMTIQGSAVQIVVVDGKFYMLAPVEMWNSQGLPPVIAANLASTWVLVPGGAEDFEDLTVGGLVDEMRSPGGTTQDEVAAGELDGEPVWELRNDEGDVMLVAAEGAPYPLQFTKTGAEEGVMRLSEFGAVAPIDPPADFIDLEDLGG